MSVFVLAYVIPSTANLPNSIPPPRVASWCIAAMEVSKQTGSEIANSTRPKKPLHLSKKLYEQGNIKTRINQLISLQCKAHRLPLSISLVYLACPQSGNLSERWFGGDDSEFWNAVPISNMSCRYYNFNTHPSDDTFIMHCENVCCILIAKKNGPSPLVQYFYQYLKKTTFWKVHTLKVLSTQIRNKI